MLKNTKVRAEQKTEIQGPLSPVREAFTPDGQVLSDRSVRYKILCDGGVNPSGVFWSKIVPPGASADVYLAAQEERDEALEQLKTLSQSQ